MIEIVAEGPAHRVESGVQQVGDGDTKQRELAVLRSTYVVERHLADPEDLIPYLEGSAFNVVQELVDGPLVGEWDLTGGEPSEWHLQIGGEPATWTDFATEVADDQDRDVVDVLQEWLDAPREASGLRAAYLEQTGAEPAEAPEA